MDTALLIRGSILGFTIAAAVGPISLLVIRRTLSQGWAMGLASGLGVATVDTFYGGVAAFGLTAVSDLLVGQARVLGLVGGLALIWIGLRTARSVPTAAASTAPSARRLAAAYGSIVGLTMVNPLTILAFAAMFASFGVTGGFDEAAAVTIGVLIGSTLWWIILTTGVGTLRGRLTTGALRWVNVVSGVAIALFGVLVSLNAIRG